MMNSEAASMTITAMPSPPSFGLVKDSSAARPLPDRARKSVPGSSILSQAVHWRRCKLPRSWRKLGLGREEHPCCYN
eukprot:1139959-Pelagomonas_calceolata.AAC.1